MKSVKTILIGLLFCLITGTVFAEKKATSPVPAEFRPLMTLKMPSGTSQTSSIVKYYIGLTAKT